MPAHPDEPSEPRHGFDRILSSIDYLSRPGASHMDYYYYADERHETWGQPNPALSGAMSTEAQQQSWRLKERMKTTAVTVAVCLNAGVDPPDIVKTQPCAKMEAWLDPLIHGLNEPKKAVESVMISLLRQYEVWQPRAKYRSYPDPTAEDLKKGCTSNRRSAKEERVLFHYNGHGVPRPTPSGEIWAFNREYSQYIPVGLKDLQSWLAAPSILVWECSAAENILLKWREFALAKEGRAGIGNPSSLSECIHLAACLRDELLPTHPSLPADLFTCCLTTPIKTALRWFVQQNPTLCIHVTPDQAADVPGKLSDRRTPLGELNWIFTAVTDTIAWTLLPQALFKKLFRQDLMVAALMRNFLLAQRVMSSYACHPISYPPLPDATRHPMWAAWDTAVDACVSQLPSLQAAAAAAAAAATASAESMDASGTPRPHPGSHGGTPAPPPPPSLPSAPYRHSTFFSDQLTAFEVWLRRGGVPVGRGGGEDPTGAGRDGADGGEGVTPPPQLPVVLQVLLSQVHRLRALTLLSRFLDLGPWAVRQALGVGIFPYVTKLLASQAVELREELAFIWARILAVDPSCQVDLAKEKGCMYFVGGLVAPDTALFPLTRIAEHRAVCAFVLTMFCRGQAEGHRALSSVHLEPTLLAHVDPMNEASGYGGEGRLLRRWCLLALAELWRGRGRRHEEGGRAEASAILCRVIVWPGLVVEVRAAALHALASLIGDVTEEGRVQAAAAASTPASTSTPAHPTPTPTTPTGPWVGRYEEEEGVDDVDGTPSTAAGRLREDMREWGVVAATSLRGEASVIVRREIVGILTRLVKLWPGRFALVALTVLEEEGGLEALAQSGTPLNPSGADGGEDGRHSRHSTPSSASASSYPRQWRLSSMGRTERERSAGPAPVSEAYGSRRGDGLVAEGVIWRTLLILRGDPHMEVSGPASVIVDSLHYAMIRDGPALFSNAKRRDRLLGGEDIEGRLERLIRIRAPPLPNRRGRPQSMYEGGLGGSVGAGAGGGANTSGHPGGSIFPLDGRGEGRGGGGILGGGGGGGGGSSGLHSSVSGLLPPLHGLRRPHSLAALHDEDRQGGGGAGSISGLLRRSTTAALRGLYYGIGGDKSDGPGASDGGGILAGSIGGGGMGAGGGAASGSGMGGGVNTLSSSLWRSGSTVREPVRPSPIEGPFPGYVPGQAVPPSLYPGGEAHGHQETISGMTFPSGVSFGPPDRMIDDLASTATPLYGTIHPIPIIPVHTRYVTWSAEHFLRPQTRAPEVNEPGSVAFNTRMWRHGRDEGEVRRMQPLQGAAARGPRWERQTGLISSEAHIMRYHAFDPLLITAGSGGVVRVFDWSSSAQRHAFIVGVPGGRAIAITSLDLINEEDPSSMLLVGTDDGMCHVYRDYASPERIRLVSAWRGLSGILPTRGAAAGTILHWQGISGTILCGGDSRTVQIWDAGEERLISSVPTKSGSCITSISSDLAPIGGSGGGNIWVAGTGDGAVRIFDKRLPPEESLVVRWKEHKSWVLGVTMQKGGRRELLSACSAGDVRLWDIRQTASSLFVLPTGEEMSSFAVHDFSPVFATSGPAHHLRIHSLATQTVIGHVRSYTGLLSQRLPPATSLAFHPQRPLLAHGGQDRYVLQVESEAVRPGFNPSEGTWPSFRVPDLEG